MGIKRLKLVTLVNSMLLATIGAYMTAAGAPHRWLFIGALINLAIHLLLLFSCTKQASQ